MKIARNSILLLVMTGLGLACGNNRNPSRKLHVFEEYFSSVTENTDEKWNFTADTVKLWFDQKNGEPVLQVRDEGSAGRWKAWDSEMHSTSYYDSIWYDEKENAVRGIFYENNDFYVLIGKKPTKTLRTYWFNGSDRISEILIYWIPEDNTTTSEHLEPIVRWAQKNDSVEIHELYPQGTIVPSADNAIRWKRLLNRYNE